VTAQPSTPPTDERLVRLAREPLRPLAAMGRRLLLAVLLVVAVTLAVYLGRAQYHDEVDGQVSLLDAFYYVTVSITTTGYGDITPVTRGGRLITALVVTPARVAFLIVLVGTTIEVLTERSREAWRIGRWRKRLHDHVIICGYGTKGRSAVDVLVGRGEDRDAIVVVDPSASAIEEANAAGLTAVHGNASKTAVLRGAGIEHARAVVVAPSYDDAAVLITLTARELNPTATIVSAVREEENAHLLRQSGADSVITSAEASGRLLGIATENPRVVDVVEDLLTAGQGLDIIERPVTEQEVGAPLSAAARPGQLPVAIVREGRAWPFNDERCSALQAGDQVVALCYHA
jgi:voltage-gated potassium channel